MRLRFTAINVIAALLIAVSPHAAGAPQTERSVRPIEGRVSVGTASLYTREIGDGPPAIVLHGGPDFDSGYLLPDLDRLKDLCRLIYYDQRGRGKSAEQVQPEDVTLASDIDDLDKVREHFHLAAVTFVPDAVPMTDT